MTHPELVAAVEELYDAFSGRPLKRPMSYCTHCVDDDEVAVLERVPLRVLSADQLERFTRKAMSTWGDVDDFAHFLPRILELFAIGEQTYGWLLHKTFTNIWCYREHWSDAEHSAIERYRDSLWRDALTTPGSWPQIDELLEGIAADKRDVSGVPERVLEAAWLATDGVDGDDLYYALVELQTRRNLIPSD